MASGNTKTRRRELNPISLSFLDVMFCGFGAVILIFLILDYASTVTVEETDSELMAEINLLEEEIREGQLGLVRVRNTLSDVDYEVVEAEGLAREIQQQIDTFLQELAALENSSVATEEDIAQLRADVQALEEELLRLQASALDQRGSSVRGFLGDGQRQALSGMYMGGQRVLILMDSSASMLDNTLVNIIRARAMSNDRKRRMPKWQKVITAVDWISTTLPITSRYQVWQFNDNYGGVLEGTTDTWLEVADRDQLNDVVAAAREVIPMNGTNLHRVFRAVSNMDPRPDNIYLITDGLPTLGSQMSNEALVDDRRRMELFNEAIEVLPSGIPVNIILLPLEGDPRAAAAYWQLAQFSQGSFLTPSDDWP